MAEQDRLESKVRVELTRGVFTMTNYTNPKAGEILKHTCKIQIGKIQIEPLGGQMEQSGKSKG